jgi:ADP-ribose pyrophosphatase
MFDDDECLRRYGALREQYPQWFENSAGCPTQILFSPDEIRAAQASVRAERAALGYPTSDLRVGVLAEDHYIGFVVRDAVRFSDGRYGLYNRVLAQGGVAVLPVLRDGIALIHIFRHALRRWSLEAPQGWVGMTEVHAEVGRRELQEEMGAVAGEMVPLGKLATSTGLTSENLTLFAAPIDGVGEPQRNEGIDSIRIILKGEIDDLVRKGTIGDGPSITLIARARLAGLL